MNGTNPTPFLLPGGPVGVLLIHGFTGSPAEMRPVGEYLHQRGFTVSGPLLPGHGTRVEDMNLCRWTDWTGHVEQALADLQSRCETVFVGGLSMGSLLTLFLAAHHSDLPGIILYSPATWLRSRLVYLTPVLKHLVRVLPPAKGGEAVQTAQPVWNYDENPVPAAHELLKLILRVRKLLPRITSPLLVVYSTGDQLIHPESARRTLERAGSTDKEMVTLHDSGHNIMVDVEWERVAEESYRFIQAHLSAPR